MFWPNLAKNFKHRQTYVYNTHLCTNLWQLYNLLIKIYKMCVANSNPFQANVSNHWKPFNCIANKLKSFCMIGNIWLTSVNFASMIVVSPCVAKYDATHYALLLSMKVLKQFQFSIEHNPFSHMEQLICVLALQSAQWGRLGSCKGQWK